MVFRNWRSLTLVEVVWNNKSVMVTAKMEKPVWLVFSTEEKAENPQTGEAKVTKHRLKRKSREVCVYLWHQAKHSAKELAAKSSQTYNQARWFKKEDANTLLKTQMKKVNSLGWRTLLARKSTYACLLLFSDLCRFADTRMKGTVC